MSITTVEAHVSIFIGILANLAYLRSLHKKLNGHLKDHKGESDV